MRVAVGVEQFRQPLNSLVGKPLSAAIATTGDQSSLALGFGCMVCPKGEAEKESLEGEEDGGEPAVRIRADGIKSVIWERERCEYELTLVIWCNWRIEMGETEVVCGSQDSAEEGRPIQTGIRPMIGDTVAEVSLNSFLDLVVVFSGGKRLRLFCDQSGHENNDVSYWLSMPTGEAYGVITALIEREGKQ